MQNTKNGGRLACAMLLGAALLWALRAGFSAADGLRVLYGGGYGLRAAAPLSAAQRENAEQAAAELGAAVTFWGEAADTVSAPDRPAAVPVTAAVISSAGDPAPAFGARWLYGRAPAAGETGTCAVSLALAEALWGGRDVTGQTLVWQDRGYTVCGVAESDAVWLLCPAPDGMALTAVELSGLPAGDPRGAAGTVAQAAGLAEGEVLYIPGGTLAAAAGLLAWLPLALAGLWMAAKTAAAALRSVPGGAVRQGIGFAAALALALALPRLLAAVPAWLIPDRWSDFGFWRALLALPGRTLQALLAAPPTVRDVALRRLLLQSGGAGAAALLCAGALPYTLPSGGKK